MTPTVHDIHVRLCHGHLQFETTVIVLQPSDLHTTLININLVPITKSTCTVPGHRLL